MRPQWQQALVGVRKRVLAASPRLEGHLQAELRGRPGPRGHVPPPPPPARHPGIEIWAPPMPPAPDGFPAAALLDTGEALAHASVGQYCLGRDRLLSDPAGEAPALTQAGLIIAPVGHRVALPWDRVT